MKKAVLLFMGGMLLLSLSVASAQTQGKKVLYIDSYHEGYAWSDGITKGVQTALSGSGVELKIFRMDTKRNNNEEFKKQAAEKAKAVIEEFKPDVVIASDDNASKFLIEPYYKGGDLPFVFCGVNWDASIYGFPVSNVTGMVEVDAVPQLIDQLKKFGKNQGDRIGYISENVETSMKNPKYYKSIFNIDIQTAFSESYEQFKKDFVDIQKNVDVLIIDYVDGWKDQGVDDFIIQNTTVPTGVFQDSFATHALIGFTKVAEEQGGWAADAALKILKGTSPADIPIAKNKEGMLILNAKVAEKLSVTIPPEILESADQIIE